MSYHKIDILLEEYIRKRPINWRFKRTIVVCMFNDMTRLMTRRAGQGMNISLVNESNGYYSPIEEGEKTCQEEN